jgi:hypothetical protein
LGGLLQPQRRAGSKRGNVVFFRELFPNKEGFLSLTEQTRLEATMLKTLMISAAVSALMVSGALAQADKPADSAKFISSQSTDQWVFSKFKGSDVLGPDNSSIGSVNDMLFDKNGKILGLIVGVGGFLGIGEKNVAIDMSSFQPVPPDTGSTSGGGAMTTRSDDPTMTKLKVTWTKDQLKEAPDFQYYKPPSRTSGAPGGTTGTGPRPTSPTAPPTGR